MNSKKFLQKNDLIDKNGKLNNNGWRLFSGLLDFVGPYPDLTPGRMPSPYRICDKLLSKIVPAAQELIIIKDKKIYLTWRNDKWWKGWHTPGAHIKPRETLKKTCQRIADGEIPGIKIKNVKLLGAVSCMRSPRAHNVILITKANFSGEPTKGKWFSSFPANFIQKNYISLLSEYLE